MNEKLVRIYVDDHLAVLVGAEALVRRMLSATNDAEIRRFLEELLPEVRDDQRAAEALLRSAGGTPSRLKQAAARVGEKVGRLKLNGKVRGYTPLSRVVELEGLGAALAADRALWEGAVAAGLGGEDARQRADRAGRRLELADELRREAAEVALAGGSRRL